MTKELLPGLLAVTDVQNGEILVKSSKFSPKNYFYYRVVDKKNEILFCIPKKYKIIGIGTADKISEQECEPIMVRSSLQEVDMSLNPIGDEKEFTYWAGKVACKTALDCLYTLLASYNLNPSTTVILTKK